MPDSECPRFDQAAHGSPLGTARAGDGDTARRQAFGTVRSESKLEGVHHDPVDSFRPESQSPTVSPDAPISVSQTKHASCERGKD